MREQASRNPLSHTVGRAEPRPAFPPPPTTSTPTSRRHSVVSRLGYCAMSNLC